MEETRNKLIECDPFSFEPALKIWECIHGYQCEKCQKTYAYITKKAEKDFPSKCKCGGRLCVLILGVSETFIKDIKTVGQLADQNTKKMGHYELQEKRHELKNRKKRGKEYINNLPQGVTPIETENNPEEYKKLKKIGKMTPQQKQNYILKGTE